MGAGRQDHGELQGNGAIDTGELIGSRPFGDLDEDRLQLLTKTGELVTVDAGTTIATAGQSSPGLYVLLDGSASIVVTIDDDHVEVGEVAPGDTFGELGVLTSAPRAATVVTTQPSRLLHLTAEALEQLLERDGAFGLALSRHLAQRLGDALGEANLQQAAQEPETTVLPAQDLNRIRAYQRRYYASAVRNLVKRHRLLVDRQFPRYRTSFAVTTDDQARWFELFDVGEDGQSTPFTYHTSSGTLLLMRIVEDVGVNFRHLMHLRSDVALHPGGRQVEPDVEYRLEAALADVVELREDRVALVLETRVHAPDDELLQLNREAFVILSIDPDAMATLRESSRFGKYDVNELTGLTEREPKLGADAEAVTVTIPEDAGVAYGRVSGDLNVVHTTKAAAKMFGHPKPFVQGLYTANHVLHALTRHSPDPVQHLAISFARRAFVGQQVEIRFDDDSFEVLDERGKLIAFGDHGAAAGRRD